MNWLQGWTGKIIAVLGVIALVLAFVVFVNWFDTREVVNAGASQDQEPQTNSLTLQNQVVQKPESENFQVTNNVNPDQSEGFSANAAEDEVMRSRVIACLGDSITYGIGADTSYDSGSWPAVLGELLGSQYDVRNYGVPGAYITDGTYSPYRQMNYLNSALEQYPFMIIMLFGSNDCRADSWNPQGFRDSYEAVIKQIRSSSPGTTLVLMSPPMTYEEEVYQGDPSEMARNAVIRDEIIPILHELVDEYGLKYIDLYSYTEPHRDWYIDGLHLTGEGYREIATYIYEELGLKTTSK